MAAKKQRERGWTPPSPFERMPFDQLSPTRLQQVPPPPHSANIWGLSLQHLSLWETFNRRGHTSHLTHHTPVTTHVSVFSLTMVMAAEGSHHCRMTHHFVITSLPTRRRICLTLLCRGLDPRLPAPPQQLKIIPNLQWSKRVSEALFIF